MAEVWTAAAPRPDSKLTGLGERLIIVPTCIDERIWRYADSGEPRSHAEKLRLLFLEKGSNDGPFAFMDRVIESLAEQQRRAIELTVVTRRKGLSKRPWMRRIRPPDAAISYPVFASWMLQRGRFDLGVHPPGEDPALAQTSILEHAALGAGTLVSVPGREKPGCDERGLVTFLSPSEGAWKEVLDRHLRVDGLLRRSQGASLHRLLQERSSRVAAEILVERLVAFGR
jgi:hypothetical protein